jgi:hypothetical protein
MHQERNVTKSIMSMCLDVTGFMKDNVNVRKDLAALCDHPSLEAKPNAKGKLRTPKTPYYLKPIERKDILRWLKTLKFSYRYAANIKQAVNVSTGKCSCRNIIAWPMMLARMKPTSSSTMLHRR